MSMLILVDLDDVVAGWNEEFDRELDLIPEAASIRRKPERTVWDLHDGLTAAEIEIVDHICTKPGFYASLEPLEGALAGIARLLAVGHDVRFVSTPWAGHATCASEKYDWLRGVAPEVGQDPIEFEKRLVLTHDKTLVQGDWLIDDRPEIHGAMTPSWERILFSAPWNAKVQGHRRADSWADVLTILGA